MDKLKNITAGVVIAATIGIVPIIPAGNGVISVAVFEDSLTGEVIHLQQSDDQYRLMGLDGGAQYNPVATSTDGLRPLVWKYSSQYVTGSVQKEVSTTTDPLASFEDDDNISLFQLLTPKAEAAIALDALTGVDISGAATSHTLSHTVTGSNPILLVGVNPDALSSVSGITYNGVAMSNQAGFIVTGSVTQRVELWYLLAPSTGANNIVVTTSSNAEPSIRGISYTGVAQSGFPDAFDNEDQAANANLTSTVTTVADNAWTVIIARSNSALTAGTGATLRDSSASNAFEFLDSNAAITPAGSTSLESVGGSSYHAHAMVSFAPSIAGAAVRIEEVMIIQTED